MAVIQEKGKDKNKRFQFYAPADLLDEFKTKKDKLEQYKLEVDMTDDFVKVLKDAIKVMDKRLGEVGQNNNTGQNHSVPSGGNGPNAQQ